jgi:hypothetical protein
MPIPEQAAAPEKKAPESHSGAGTACPFDRPNSRPEIAVVAGVTGR